MAFLKTLNRNIVLICLLGLIARIIFTIFFAEQYFNRESIYYDRDTGAWLGSFINLIENGSYSINPSHEYGAFVRLPGYSFLLGAVYYLTGSNPDITFPLMGWLQILLDVFTIWLVYKVALKVFAVEKISLLVAGLYALYPFVIAWNPVTYSESVSIFLMMGGLYFLLHEHKHKFFLTGLFIGLGVLFRPQIIFLIPLIGIYILYINNWKWKRFFKPALLFSLSIVIFYGVWPISNYIVHKKVILTQDLRGASNWNEDVIAFMQYTYSVKTEWEPQFSNILHNKEVRFPENAYFCKEDSLKLERAIYLAKNCGSGFSRWVGYWKETVNDTACTEEIAKLFNELRESQIKNFPWNFYLYLPLQNLKKAVFKNELYDTTGVRKYASYLFYYRTLLILAGFAGAFLLVYRKRKEWLIFLLFPLLLYLSLCFGTGVQFRNMEIRYFLHADIILLFGAGYLLNEIRHFFSLRFKNHSSSINS
jgi:hypothetical protein